MNRVWLDVPFSQKNVARAAGARWDADVRRWYAPHGLTSALQPWAPLPDLPDLLPGEDRQFGAGLFVDLVPRSCWFTNARSCVNEVDWERLRRMVVGRAAHRCEACGAATDSDGWPLSFEVHERWHYEVNQQNERIQHLRRLICMCYLCHRATHLAKAHLDGEGEQALEHLMHVNSWSREQAQAHYAEARATWTERSASNWALDLSILTDAGIRTIQAPRPERRRIIADQQLRGEK